MTISSIDDFVSAKHSTYVVCYYGAADSPKLYTSPHFNSTATMATDPSRWSVGAIYRHAFPASTGTVRTGVRVSGVSTGAFAIKDPEPGKNKYFYGVEGIGSAGTFKILDLLIYCTGLSTTSTGGWVDFNTTYLPARDATGGSDGYGVKAAIVFGGLSSANTDLSTGAILVEYVNSDGVPNRTGSINEPRYNLTMTAAFLPVTPQYGDKGIRSVSRVRFNTGVTSAVGPYPSNTTNLVLYRELGPWIFCNSPASFSSTMCFDMNDFGLHEIYSGTTLITINDRHNSNTFSPALLMFKFAEK